MFWSRRGGVSLRLHVFENQSECFIQSLKKWKIIPLTDLELGSPVVGVHEC